MRRGHRLQPVDEGVAGNQRLAGDDVARIGLHRHLAAVAGNASCPRVFIEPRPGSRSGPRQPDHVFERIDVACPRVMRAAVIARRAKGRRKLLAVKKPQALVAILLGHDFHMVAVILDVARLVRSRDLSGAEVGVDPVRVGKREQMHLRPLGHGKLRLGVVAAEIGLAFFHPGPLSGAKLPAIAARGAVAEARALDQHHILAACGQVIGRLQPGEAAADDDDVGSRGTGQEAYAGRSPSVAS